VVEVIADLDPQLFKESRTVYLAENDRIVINVR